MVYVAALGCAGGLVAQVPNQLLTDLKQNYNETRSLLLAEADRMPDAAYAFKATPDVGTFGSRMAHVAEAQFAICSAVKGESKKSDLTGKASKADIAAALKASFNYCDGVYNSLTGASAAQMVTIFGETQSKLSALWSNVAHNNEMYGYMAVYLRLKGLVPPSSDRSPK
jgi:DinB superfamily